MVPAAAPTRKNHRATLHRPDLGNRCHTLFLSKLICSAFWCVSTAFRSCSTCGGNVRLDESGKLEGGQLAVRCISDFSCSPFLIVIVVLILAQWV